MKSYSLPRSSLLKTSREYQSVYTFGKRVKGKNFKVIYSPNNRPENRLGISIHGQLRGVVKRNRIKRIIREFYRLNRTFLQRYSSRGDEMPAMDIVITVHKDFQLNSPREVEQAINAALQQSGTNKTRNGLRNDYASCDC